MSDKVALFESIKIQYNNQELLSFANTIIKSCISLYHKGFIVKLDNQLVPRYIKKFYDDVKHHIEKLYDSYHMPHIQTFKLVNDSDKFDYKGNGVALASTTSLGNVIITYVNDIKIQNNDHNKVTIEAKQTLLGLAMSDMNSCLANEEYVSKIDFLAPNDWKDIAYSINTNIDFHEVPEFFEIHANHYGYSYSDIVS